MSKTFSPNMLKTFEACPQKYYFKYVQKISVPQKSSLFDKGKKVHALAHYYLRGDDISKLETTLNDGEKEAWEKLKNNEYFQKTYVNSEYNLSCKVGDYWIGGRLDALMKDENSYFILDYKTGQIPKNPENDFQTIVYLLCASKKFTRSPHPSPLKGAAHVAMPEESGVFPSFLKGEGNNPEIKFVYIDLKNDKNCVTDYDKDYETPIKEICARIENFEPLEEINHSKMCEFCEYRKICI